MQPSFDKSLPDLNSFKTDHLIVVSNKGLMKLRSGETTDINVMFKHINVKDVLQKEKGAEKIQSYFNDYRIGYINEEGKHKINSKLLKEVNTLLNKVKVEKGSSENLAIENGNPQDVDTSAPVFEEMNETEYKDLESKVKTMVDSALENKKAKQTEGPQTQGPSAKNTSEPVKGNSDEKFVRKMQKQMDETQSKMLDKFAQNAKEVQAQKDERYKKDLLQQDQIKEGVKVEDQKKWDHKKQDINNDNKARGG